MLPELTLYTVFDLSETSNSYNIEHPTTYPSDRILKKVFAVQRIFKKSIRGTKYSRFENIIALQVFAVCFSEK